MKTLNELWINSCKVYPDRAVIHTRRSESIKNESGQLSEVISYDPITYRQLDELIVKLGAGLIQLGLKEREAVACIAENSARWMIANFAILGNQAFNVPRGTSSTLNEIEYIINHAEAKFLFIENEAQLKRLSPVLEKLSGLEAVIILDPAFTSDDRGKKIYTFDQILAQSQDHVVLFEQRRKGSQPGDIATIMYTSGTSGIPKGIPLTHANIMHNILTLPGIIRVKPDDRFLSILPIWHTFEITVEYYIFSCGASLWYTTSLTFIKDLTVANPHYLASVPRIWNAIYNNFLANMRILKKEKLFFRLYKHSLKVIQAERAKEQRQCVMGPDDPPKVQVTMKDYLYHYVGDFLIYKKVREKFGKNFIAGISGGSSLPEHIDDFFDVFGFILLEGYGLTETSPIVCVRAMDHRIPYTAGQPLPQTKVRICDDHGNEVPDGEKGIIWIHGPQVMSGYFKNLEETAKVMQQDSHGKMWFNSMDLGFRSRSGDIVVTGRAKDTIVLLGGENVEPGPIEDILTSSDLITQVMVCGQDQEHLTALIVPNENLLRQKCQDLGIKFDKSEIQKLSQHKELKKIYQQVINELLTEENGFKEIDEIHNIAFTIPFVPEDNTLTNTLKLKRNNVLIRDRDLIKAMYPRYNEPGAVKGAKKK